MVAEELHVLFRQRVASETLDEGAQPHAFSGSQDDRAAIANVGLIDRFVKHVSKLEQYRGHDVDLPHHADSRSRRNRYDH